MFRRFQKTPSAQDLQADANLQLARELADNETRQRETIRYECQLFYDRHATEVKSRYSPRQFSAYLAEWMHDRIPVALVRERAENLKQMIREFIEPTESAEPELTDESIRSHFLQIINEIKDRQIDQDTKDAMVAEAYFAQERALRTRRLH